MNNQKTLLLAQPFEFKNNKQEQQETMTTPKQEKILTPTDIVDDAELLAILGIINPSTVLDWDDMPELSDDEDGSKKRKYTQDEDDDDLFADFDFDMVVPPPSKKTRSFLDDITFNSSEDIISIVNEEDMRLACELTSS